MADGLSGKKRRIRKTAPTLRERAEAAKAEVDSPKPQRIRKGLSRLQLPDNAFSRKLGSLWRPVRKVLLWLVPRYFVNSWREVRQVTWPSRKETWRLTLAVFIFALVFGSTVFVVDKGLDEFFKKVVLK